MINQTLSKTAIAIVIAAMAAVYFMFIHYVPFCHDDWNFREMYLRVSGGEWRFTCEWFNDYANLVRFENDGRLSDISIILFEFLPRWVYDVFFSVCCVAWIALSVRCTEPSRRLSAVALVAFWLLSVLFLPWRDWVMGSVVFSLNYVVASAVTAVFVFVWTGRISKAGIFGCAIAGLCAGCWHEGFGVPLAVGVILFAASRRKFPDVAHTIAFVALAAGVALAMTAPGIIRRMGADGDSAMIVVNFKYVLRDMTMVLAFAVTVAVMATKRQWRKRLAETWNTTALPLFAGACVAATVIVLKKGFTFRVAWPAEYFAIMALMTLFSGALRAKYVRPVAAVAFAGILAFYANVIVWQKRTCREINEIMRLYEQSPDGVVYYDYDVSTPIVTLHHPSRSQMTEPTTGEFLQKADPENRRLRIVPSAQCVSGGRK